MIDIWAIACLRRNSWVVWPLKYSQSRSGFALKANREVVTISFFDNEHESFLLKIVSLKKDRNGNLVITNTE